MQRQSSLLYSRAFPLVLLSQQRPSVAHLLKCSLLAEPWPVEERIVKAQKVLLVSLKIEGCATTLHPLQLRTPAKLSSAAYAQAKSGPCPLALFASQPGRLLDILLHL